MWWSYNSCLSSVDKIKLSKYKMENILLMIVIISSWIWAKKYCAQYYPSQKYIHTLLFLAYTVFATKLNEYCNHAYLSNVTLEKSYKSNKHNFISIKLIVFINKFKFQPTLYDFFFKIEKLYDLIEILKKSAS